MILSTKSCKSYLQQLSLNPFISQTEIKSEVKNTHTSRLVFCFGHQLEGGLSTISRALKVISRSPKVTNPIRKKHFFLEANSPQHLTSTPKRKETNWSLPAPAPLYPYIMPPLYRLLGPTSFPQIALRGLSSVFELSRQPVRISEEGISSRRGSVMAPLRPAAHFDYLVSHNQPPTGPVWCHAIS